MPSGFAAGSVSFVSDRIGWVLGTAPCPRQPCTSLLRTTDGGASWVGLPAPPAMSTRLDSHDDVSDVSKLRFATTEIGYAFGPGLWQTSNGGGSWSRPKSVIGISPYWVSDLAAVGGQVVATISDEDRQNGGQSGRTWIVAARPGGTFHLLKNLGSGGGRSVSTAGRGALVLDGPRLWRVDSSDHVIRSSAPEDDCDITGASASDLLAICGQGEMSGSFGDRRAFRSHDGGTHWARMTDPPRGAGYDGEGVTANAARDAVIGTVGGGASGLLTSSDGARTWHRSLWRDESEAVGFDDLGFEDNRTGVVIYGAWKQPDPQAHGAGVPARGELYRTVDGGEHWRLITF